MLSPLTTCTYEPDRDSYCTLSSVPLEQSCATMHFTSTRCFEAHSMSLQSTLVCLLLDAGWQLLDIPASGQAASAHA